MVFEYKMVVTHIYFINLQAAERRMQENQGRGIKDVEKVTRMEQRSREIERLEEEAAKKGLGKPDLRVVFIIFLS